MSTNQELNKICVDCKEEFKISSGDLDLYKKVGLELPKLCFLCRIKLYLSFWSFGKFRKGKSDLSGESLITVLPEKSPYPIYTLHEWHSDKWDALDYGVDYDPSVSFFTQLKNLQEKIPRPHQVGSKNTGCDWCDDVWTSKNCYLSRSMLDCENLFYSYRNIRVKNSIDTTICFDCEKCYGLGDCHHSYKLFYSEHSRDCIDSYFLYDCRNCNNCFMSWNLRNKSYCIENVQYSKEEYQKKMQDIDFGSYSQIRDLKNKFLKNLAENAIHRENYNFRSFNSTGDYLVDVKNCNNCVTISDSEDCADCLRGAKLKSCIDMTGSFNVELSGSCSMCQPEGYAMKYCVHSSSRYSEYLDLCVQCEYCFGCVGLKKKKYCILNKQYTKEDYETLRNKIIADMKQRDEYGDFPSYAMSPGPFNFSTGILYFPETTKEEIVGKGGWWEQVDESTLEGMPTSELSDNIKDIPDDITTQALICPETGWRFNITNNELSFYRENNIPLPRYHFDVRIKKQLKYLTVLDAYPYKCIYCKNDIMAYYLPEWGYQKIACEECYKQNIA